jgi:hypothetical protein
MPIVLVGITVALFLMFTNPLYEDISALRVEVSAYNDALNNSKMLENERDKLTAKYNSIDPANLVKLERMMPENVDNIRLILEIEQIAAPYGMALQDVKYNVIDPNEEMLVTGIQGAGSVKSAPKDYGVFDLEFSTVGSYNNFINFTKDLESNLRIVDISSVVFSSEESGFTTGGTSSASEIYKYNFKIKTYWLKN